MSAIILKTHSATARLIGAVKVSASTSGPGALRCLAVLRGKTDAPAITIEAHDKSIWKWPIDPMLLPKEPA